MSQENKKQLEQEQIGVVVKLAGKAVTFKMRMISIAEETQLRQRFSALTDEERAEKEYQINLDALTTFSNGSDVILDEAGESYHIIVSTFFKEKTPFTERVAEYAIRGWLSKLTPETSFI